VRAEPAPSRHQRTFEWNAQAFGCCNGLFDSEGDEPSRPQRSGERSTPNPAGDRMRPAATNLDWALFLDHIPSSRSAALGCATIEKSASVRAIGVRASAEDCPRDCGIARNAQTTIDRSDAALTTDRTTCNRTTRLPHRDLRRMIAFAVERWCRSAAWFRA
jgi:hypothetical protein